MSPEQTPAPSLSQSLRYFVSRRQCCGDAPAPPSVAGRDGTAGIRPRPVLAAPLRTACAPSAQREGMCLNKAFKREDPLLPSQNSMPYSSLTAARSPRQDRASKSACHTGIHLRPCTTFHAQVSRAFPTSGLTSGRCPDCIIHVI